MTTSASSSHGARISAVGWIAIVATIIFFGTDIFMPDHVQARLVGTVAELALGCVAAAGGVAFFVIARRERSVGLKEHSSGLYALAILLLLYGLGYIADYLMR